VHFDYDMKTFVRTILAPVVHNICHLLSALFGTCCRQLFLHISALFGTCCPHHLVPTVRTIWHMLSTLF